MEKYKIACQVNGIDKVVTVKGTLVMIGERKAIVHHPYLDDIKNKGYWVVTDYLTGMVIYSSDIKTDAMQEAERRIKSKEALLAFESARHLLIQIGIKYPVNE